MSAPLDVPGLQPWRDPGYADHIDRLLAENEELRLADYLYSELLGEELARDCE